MKRICIILGILLAFAMCSMIVYASNEIQPRQHMNDNIEAVDNDHAAADENHLPIQLAQARPQMDRPPARDPEKFNEMIAWRIIKYLDLNEEQAEKFIPIFKESNKKRGSLMREKDELVDKLAADIDNSNISIKELQKQLNEIKKVNNAIMDERETFMKKMDGFLNEHQAIKLEIFEDKFRIDLSRRLEESNRRRREDNSHE